MGIHGDDVVIAIRKGLREIPTCNTMTPPRYVEGRDGTYVFEAVGRDWFRWFRITVECIEQDEVVGDIQGGDEFEKQTAPQGGTE